MRDSVSVCTYSCENLWNQGACDCFLLPHSADIKAVGRFGHLSELKIDSCRNFKTEAGFYGCGEVKPSHKAKCSKVNNCAPLAPFFVCKTAGSCGKGFLQGEDDGFATTWVGVCEANMERCTASRKRHRQGRCR
eukprot:3394712-Amphidinium_carterae.1